MNCYCCLAWWVTAILTDRPLLKRSSDWLISVSVKAFSLAVFGVVVVDDDDGLAISRAAVLVLLVIGLNSVSVKAFSSISVAGVDFLAVAGYVDAEVMVPGGFVVVVVAFAIAWNATKVLYELSGIFFFCYVLVLVLSERWFRAAVLDVGTGAFYC